MSSGVATAVGGGGVFLTHPHQLKMEDFVAAAVLLAVITSVSQTNILI